MRITSTVIIALLLLFVLSSSVAANYQSSLPQSTDNEYFVAPLLAKFEHFLSGREHLLVHCNMARDVIWDFALTTLVDHNKTTRRSALTMPRDLFVIADALALWASNVGLAFRSFHERFFCSFEHFECALYVIILCVSLLLVSKCWWQQPPQNHNGEDDNGAPPDQRFGGELRRHKREDDSGAPPDQRFGGELRRHNREDDNGAPPPQSRQTSAINLVLNPVTIPRPQRKTDFERHVQPSAFYPRKDSLALRILVVCFDNLSWKSYITLSKADETLKVTKDPARFLSMQKAIYEALRMLEDLESDVGLLTEIGGEAVQFLRDLIDDFFFGRYECHAVMLGEQGRYWNVLIIRRASFSSFSPGKICASFFSSKRGCTQENTLEYPQCTLESPLFPGEPLVFLGVHAVPCNITDVRTCIDATLPVFANSNPRKHLIGFGDWNFKVLKVDSCHVDASIALNLNVVGNVSNNAGAFTSRGLATQWFLIPTPPNFDGMKSKCKNHSHHFVMDLVSAPSGFSRNNYHPLPAPAASNNNLPALPAPAASRSFGNNFHSPPAPAAQLLAELNDQHFKTLQKFCREGPNARFSGLQLPIARWHACLESGQHCKERMITNITAAVRILSQN